MKKWIATIAMGCLATGCTGAGKGNEGAAALRLDRESLTRQGAYINPEMLGFNLLYWIDTDEMHASGRLVGEINGIRPGMLRYPAGSASQNYDWPANRTVNTNLWPFSPSYALLASDSFISIMDQTGADAFVVVDIASAHLKDRRKARGRGEDGYQVAQPVSAEEEQAMVDKAVAWAKHFKARGHSPVYEMGNEHYLAFLDYMVFTPEMYAEKCRRFIQAIREVDPEARFGIGGPSGFYMKHSFYRDMVWWPVVLKELAGEVERVIVHTYWPARAIDNDLDIGGPYGKFIKEMEAWGRREGIPTGHLKLGFTEWGARGLKDRDLYGTFVFQALAELADNGVQFAVQWPFRWKEDESEFGGVQLIGQDTGEKQFAYHVMAAWSRHFSGRHIASPSQKIPGADGCRYFAAIGRDGRPVLGLSNAGKTVQAIRLEAEWPAPVRRLALAEVSAEGIRDAGTIRARSPNLLTLKPGTVLVVAAE